MSSVSTPDQVNPDGPGHGPLRWILAAADGPSLFATLTFEATDPDIATDQDQAISPSRSTKRPEPWPGPSVASRTMASVPSVTVCGPEWPLRSVAV